MDTRLKDATPPIRHRESGRVGDPPINAKELLTRYSDGERDFRHAQLSMQDLHGVNLSFVNLSISDLSGTNLAGARLTGALLDDGCLENANLRGVCLKAASAKRVRMKAADLTGADLGALDVGYRPEEIQEFGFHGIGPGAADFEEADLRYVNFTEADLTLVSFERVWCQVWCQANLIDLFAKQQNSKKVCPDPSFSLPK